MKQQKTSSEINYFFVGEGQGTKDVSDQIDNEDMLDGAYDGKEKTEEEEKNVPEEDQGIEMSEDFDSHMQARELWGFFLQISLINIKTVYIYLFIAHRSPC